jgi:hypothetical protein
MPTYLEGDLERIADALGKALADILPYGNEFEAAATLVSYQYSISAKTGPRSFGTAQAETYGGYEEYEALRAPQAALREAQNIFELRKKGAQVEAAARK